MCFIGCGALPVFLFLLIFHLGGPHLSGMGFGIPVRAEDITAAFISFGAVLLNFCAWVVLARGLEEQGAGRGGKGELFQFAALKSTLVLGVAVFLLIGNFRQAMIFTVVLLAFLLFGALGLIVFRSQVFAADKLAAERREEPF